MLSGLQPGVDMRGSSKQDSGHFKIQYTDTHTYTHTYFNHLQSFRILHRTSLQLFLNILSIMPPCRWDSDSDDSSSDESWDGWSKSQVDYMEIGRFFLALSKLTHWFGRLRVPFTFASDCFLLAKLP